jgi:hypothetical protein
MSQLKQDEWPSDGERTTEETQVEISERDVRGRPEEPGGGAGATKIDQRASNDDLLNLDPDDAVD